MEKYSRKAKENRSYPKNNLFGRYNFTAIYFAHDYLKIIHKHYVNETDIDR